LQAENGYPSISGSSPARRRNGYEIDGKGRAIFGTVLTMAQDDPKALDAPIEDNITRDKRLFGAALGDLDTWLTW
jgi:hypothetical protein